MIKIDKLNKYYGSGGANQVHAVNDVSLTLPDSGMVAIFGKSGCGKTTLLNMIGGLDKASSGEVFLDGKRITPDSDEERNLKVGYIFQNYNLSDRMSVYENVATSLRLCGMTDEAEIEARVLAALRSVDMEKYRKRIPTALSGGQQQRVAIARAIVKNPALILADEPTGNLDEQNTVMVMDLLKSLSRERLVLLVTHEAHLVDSYCDKVIGVSDGKIFEERENEITEGYSGKKANEVYLGDMEREELTDGEITLEYFGDPQNKPANLRIISAGGVLYLSSDENIRLKLIDKSSELIVHEGKYVAKKKSEPAELPDELKAPITAQKKSGRLYNLKGAIKSGFNSNFAKKRKRKILLILTMMCFAAIIVFVVGIFGSAIKSFMTVEQYFNSHTIGVDATAMTNDEARDVVSRGDAELYVVSGNFSKYSPNVHEYLNFSFGNYDTASYGIRYENSGSENVMALPSSMLEDRNLIVGRAEIKAENEIVITEALADTVIEMMGRSNVKDYSDLIYASVSSNGRYGYYYNDMGLIAPGSQSVVNQFKVVGVVSGSDEEAFYDEYIYLQKRLSNLYGVNANFFSDIAHSGLDLPALEQGSIYTISSYSYADGRKAVIGGDTYNIADTYKVSISDEQLAQYCRDYYGFDITKGVEAYVQYYYGFSSISDWAINYYGKELSKEEALSILEGEYQSYLEGLRSECLMRMGNGVPQVIMTIEDMKRVATAYSIGEKGEGLTSGIYRGGSYVFYTDDAKALGEELIAKYGESFVTTPESSRDFLRAEYYGTFVSLASVLAVVSAIMSLCLYFIMRSSLMGDIREVGINRAIGVSKRNLSYRYLVETLLLFVLTIFVGFLLSSILVSMLSSLGATLGGFVYYPWWLAAITLIGIMIITVICGQLPIRSLLRRSPAEILAKYDI